MTGRPRDTPIPGPDDCLAGGGDLGARMRAMDWSRTPLGPVADWPQSLKTCVRIVLTSRQPMFVWWGDQLINLYNDEYRSILGGKHPEALGQPAQVVWREIWDQVGPRAETAMRTDEGTYDEALLLVMERNGYPEETYYTFSYSPVPNDQGGTGGILCANTEDTQRIIGARQMGLMRDLAASATDARTAADACARAAEGLATDPRDLPFALLYLVDPTQPGSARREGMTGLPADHPAAPSTLALDGAAPWPLDEVLRTHEPVVVTDLATRFGRLPTGAWPHPPTQAVLVPIFAVGPGGRPGALIVGLSPMRLFDEGYRGFLTLVAGQIGATVANAQAYEEAKQRAEALAEIDRAKTAFFSNVSHEFRTPLTLLLGPTEDALATSGALTGETLATVHRNALRLLRLVNSLLDFSRIEAGRVQAAYAPVDLARFTTDLSSAFRAAIERAGLTLTVDCPPLDEPVYVDASMWEKVVLNLLSNAFKFTFDGGITVSLRAIDGRAVLRVEDTGTGIPRDQLSKVFQRFHRVEGARSRSFEGSGIGLALVQELVRLHGGAIDVTSQPDRGTTFTVQLPFGHAHLPDDRVTSHASSVGGSGALTYVEEALRWLPAAASPAVSPNDLPSTNTADPLTEGRRAHVLLADDNADMRDYVRRLLDARFEVETVMDGVEALAAARARVPDLVLTDVMMPRLDGFGLLRALRADPMTQTVPVVMLSARAGEEARSEGIEAGADDYLTKPFSARELLARVSLHLELARARREAEIQRRHLRDLFMQAPAGICVLRGPEHLYELANPIYRGLIGGRDPVGRTIRDALPELAGQGVYELLDQVYATGQPFVADEFAIQLVRPDDGELAEYVLNFIYQAYRNEAGEVQGIFVFAFDVTEQVRARRQLEAAAHERAELLSREQRARADAEQANRLKDEFLATMSHELRTPLNAILGWAHMLRAGTLPEAKRERALDAIQRNARTQAELIEDVLDIARIVSGKMRLAVGPVHMVTVVESAVDTVRPAAVAKGVRLRLDLDPAVGETTGDPNRLQQVVWNLLSNAVKFTPRDGVVRVRLRRDDSAVELTVSDSGEGIDMTFLPYVFERFRQADATTTRVHGGLGLGLSIVKHLVELHGGTIWADSDGPGRGATFTVRIPIASGRASVEPSPPGTDLTRPSAPIVRPPALAGLRALVVDDVADARELIESVLHECGLTVTTADSVTTALARLDKQSFDVIVSDIGMPGADGYTLIRTLRARTPEAGGRTPAVALTAYARTEDRTRALAEGFDQHVGKPVDPNELIAAVAAVTVRPSNA